MHAGRQRRGPITAALVTVAMAILGGVATAHAASHSRSGAPIIAPVDAHAMIVRELASADAGGWTLTPVGRAILNGRSLGQAIAAQGPGSGSLAMLAYGGGRPVPAGVGTVVLPDPTAESVVAVHAKRTLQGVKRALYATTAYLFCSVGVSGYQQTIANHGDFVQTFELTNEYTGQSTNKFAGDDTCTVSQQPCWFLGGWDPNADWAVDTGTVTGNNTVSTWSSWCG